MAAKGASVKLDFGTVAGMLIALGAIVGGLILEGGVVQDIAQYTAALIVVGGTLGAVLVNTPWKVFRGAMGRLKDVFFSSEAGVEETIEDLASYANKARRTGLVSLEDEAMLIQDDYLRKALGMAVDGSDLSELRSTMELEIALYEHRAEAEAKVFESAGGYSPTIGIIGAVLGLIQVMKHLDDIKEVGHGIAVAFVATVYGVAMANVFFLPAANKIKARIAQETERREMILEGVVGIVEGLNPKLIRAKLEAYLPKGAADAKPRSGPRSMAA